MASRAQTVGRWILAGPVALFAAILAMAATPVWLPAGTSGVDNIVLPIVLFPAYWAAFFLLSLIANNVRAALLAVLGVSALHGALIYTAFTA